MNLANNYMASVNPHTSYKRMVRD